jgi:hypothetical protein
MSTEKREIAVKKYFIKTPDEPKYDDTTWVMILTIGGLIASLIGISDFGSNWWLLLIGGIVAWSSGSSWITKHNDNKRAKENYESAYKQAEPKASDQQMDNWRNADLERIRKSALAKLDLAV